MKWILTRVFRIFQELLAYEFRCPCVRVQVGTWIDIELDRISLFFPLHGHTAKKRCGICDGTGIYSRRVRKICWSAWPGKLRRYA